MASVPNGVQKLRKILIVYCRKAHEHYRQTDRQMDGRTMTYSKRERTQIYVL